MIALVLESVKKHRKRLMPGDREAYPLRGKLVDPNWPFHYVSCSCLNVSS